MHDWLESQHPTQMPNSKMQSMSSTQDSEESNKCNEEIQDWETSTWDSSSTLSAADTTSDDSEASIGSCETLATPPSDGGSWGWDSMSAWDSALTAPTEVASWDNSFYEPEPEPTNRSSLPINNRFTLTATSHPTLLSLLTASSWSLSLSPASKHALITSLKRLLEHACFSIVDRHACFELELLSLNTYDAIDINAWITLLHKLRSESKDSDSEDPETRRLDAALTGDLPNVNVFCKEEIDYRRDTIGRLRHVAVHRWDYDNYLIHQAVAFLATLRDEQRMAEFEELARAAVAGELKLGKRYTTKQELLTSIVITLEEAFYRFAKAHDPDLDIEHAHALELHFLAEKVIGPRYGLKLEVEEIKELLGVCRALRNMEAHHNSFSKEAIQGRKDGGPVHCMYDEEEEPYRAVARDAERVALMIGDEGAAREKRLALWAADVGLRDTARIGDEDDGVDTNGDDNDPTDYVGNARLAADRRPKSTRDTANYEGERTVFQRYGEAIAYHQRCAADLIPEVSHIFEEWSKWSSATIRPVVDPRHEHTDQAADDFVDSLDWTSNDTPPTSDS